MLKGLAWGGDFAGRIKREKFRVHSVFRAVCNLSSGQGKPLLALVSERDALAPNVLWVGQSRWADLIRPGDEVEATAGGVGCGDVMIDCTGVVLYRRAPCHSPCLEDDTLEQVRNWLEVQAPGFALAQSRLASLLRRGLQEENDKLLRAALKGLLGAGPGLTPCGDDFAAGALHAYVRAREREAPFPRRLPGIVAEAALATNEISRTMLWYAARGQGPAYMAEVVDGILSGAPGVLLAANRLRQVGSSSGLYLLAGILLGCETTGTREQMCDGRENPGQAQHLL